MGHVTVTSACQLTFLSRVAKQTDDELKTRLNVIVLWCNQPNNDNRASNAKVFFTPCSVTCCDALTGSLVPLQFLLDNINLLPSCVLKLKQIVNPFLELQLELLAVKYTGKKKMQTNVHINDWTRISPS